MAKTVNTDKKKKRRDYGQGSYRLRGNKYYIRIYHPITGVRIEEATDQTTEKGARDYIDRRKAELAMEYRTDLRSMPKKVAATLTVMDIVDQYAEARRDKERDRLEKQGATEAQVARPRLGSDDNIIEASLRPFFSNVKWVEFDTQHTVEYRKERRKHLRKNGDNARAGTARGRKQHVGHNSINRELQVLRAAVNRLIRDGSPLAKLVHISMESVSDTRKGFLTPSKFLGELDPVLRSPERRHIRDLVVMLFCSGVRKSEALRLKWEHVFMSDPNPDNWSLLILKSKNNNQREIPIFNGVMREMFIRAKERVTRLGLKNPYVFQSIRNDNEPIKAFNRAWRSAVKAADIRIDDGTYLRPHDLRRSAARNMRDAEIQAESVMAFMGHKSHSMLLRYNIISAEELRAGREKMNVASAGWARYQVA